MQGRQVPSLSWALAALALCACNADAALTGDDGSLVAESGAAGKPDTSLAFPIPLELRGKIFVGYQGWFRTPHDATDEQPDPLAPLTFSLGFTLSAGHSAGTASNPGAILSLQNDGNLVVYDKLPVSGTKVVWTSNTAGKDCASRCKMTFQRDGNLVLTQDGKPYWATGTYGVNATTLVLRNRHPYLEIQDAAGVALWSLPWGNWSHWGSSPMSSETLTVDMWPDVSEYPAEALETVPAAATHSLGTLGNGKASQLFSSLSKKTTDLHVKWMQTYGIDGAFVQRFALAMGSPASTPTSSPLPINLILDQVRRSAEQYKRQFVVMYDITSASANPRCFKTNPATGTSYTPDPTLGAAAPGFSLAKCIEEDWMNLVDQWAVTGSKSYLRVGGRPLVVLWGVGLSATISGGCEGRGCRYVTNTSDILELIQWFQAKAPAQYQAKVMGGTPTYWRSQTIDSLADADAPSGAPTWTQVYRSFDILSPWMVGRVSTPENVDDFANTTLKADLTAVHSAGQGYMPVVFPGHSFYFTGHNSRGGGPSDFPLNHIPRRCGKFLWQQFADAYSLGLSTFYIAMFDEVNEGTAIFKTAATSQAAPAGVSTLTLDADGCALPSDWYLQLGRQMSQMVKGQTPFRSELPFGLMPSELAPPLTLTEDRSVKGPSVQLRFQSDGNLVLYDMSGTALWASNTAGKCAPAPAPVCTMTLQRDGNLVLSQGSSPYWATGTGKHPSAKLVISDQPPYLSIVEAGGTLWSSGD